MEIGYLRVQLFVFENANIHSNDPTSLGGFRLIMKAKSQKLTAKS